MIRNVLVFCNETKDPSGEHTNRLLSYLRGHGIRIFTFHQGLPDDVTRIDQAEGHGIELALVLGGDGTMNHVVNTLINEKLQVPVCYIPGGSTNDFAKSIYNGTIPSLEKICRSFTDGRLFYYDIGSINDTYFNYVAAFGVVF